ncbi:hypothetical protein [uncultured Sphaerochaeta sp.]|uniref:hypothetical protein n=1 Tax=uncultured Sphaerochaeta sp. TaxID=886478 RepID=UPI002AA92A8D|nr:hypothetical protein [uncultured Sphaerochaeta sp.]
MASRVRTITCTVLLFLLSCLSVYASNSAVRVEIIPSESEYVFFRYQTGEAEKDVWVDVELSSPVQILEHFDSTQDRLFIQQSKDAQNWSRSYAYRYIPEERIWEIIPNNPIDTSIVDSIELKLYNLYPIHTSATYYAYVLGTGMKMNFALDKQKTLIGYGEVAYSRGPSNCDWVDLMQAANMSIGLGYRYKLTDKLQVAPEFGYGLVLHLLNADFDQDGTKSFETFIDQQVRLSVNLTYALSDTYSLLIAPLGVLFFEKGNFGTLMGLQAGLRYNF